MGSGGGFSQYTARPSWQEQHVSKYISSADLPDASWWNWTGTTGIAGETGRAVPDLAAPCKNYPLVINGASYLADGTSASAPVVAGMLASLNDARVAATCPGFVASKGWDPVTGLGIPQFDKLK